LLGFAKNDIKKPKGFLKNKSKNQRFFDPKKSVSGLCPDTQVPPGKIPGGGMCVMPCLIQAPAKVIFSLS